MPFIPPAPVDKRPTEPNCRPTDTDGMLPDRIIVDGNKTYMCYKMIIVGNIYKKFNSWRIVLIEQTGDETWFLYPFGLDAYNFNPTHIESYTYNEKY
jgi:hypothetical protein